MKPFIKSITLTVFALFVGITTYAQRGEGPTTPEEMADKQTERMAKHLELTEEQKKEVRAINLDYAQKMMEIRKETKEDRSATRASMKSMNQEKSEALKKVLSEEQLEKLEKADSRENRPKRGNRGKGRRGNRG